MISKGKYFNGSSKRKEKALQIIYNNNNIKKK